MITFIKKIFKYKRESIRYLITDIDCIIYKLRDISYLWSNFQPIIISKNNLNYEKPLINVYVKSFCIIHNYF